MKYLMYFMKGCIVAIGIYMMVKFPNPGTPPFTSGIAFTLVGVCLALQGCCGEDSSCCETKKK